MKRHSKLSAREQFQQSATEQQSVRTGPLEFETPETMLRHDALHTIVPPAIAVRLQESLGALPPPPPRPWWRRFLGS